MLAEKEERLGELQIEVGREFHSQSDRTEVIRLSVSVSSGKVKGYEEIVPVTSLPKSLS